MKLRSEPAERSGLEVAIFVFFASGILVSIVWLTGLEGGWAAFVSYCVGVVLLALWVTLRPSPPRDRRVSFWDRIRPPTAD